MRRLFAGCRRGRNSLTEQCGGGYALWAVGPVIDVAPGAENQALARELAELVRGNVARDPGKRADFERLRGAIAIIADDRSIALTLRFDFGRLVVHTGVIGIPDVTLRGPTLVLESLGDLPRRSLPAVAGGILRGTAPSAALVGAVGERTHGQLKIYGLITHPLMVRRLLSVLSKPA